MNTLQRATRYLIATSVALAGLNAIVYFQARANPPTTTATQPTGAWERWRSLSQADQLAYVRQYEAVVQSPDAATTLIRAREFRNLPASRQQRLREVRALLDETIARQRPTEQRGLLRSAERARAFNVYQILLNESPKNVAALRAAWSDEP